MVDGLEMITDLLTRYTIFEHLYLQEAMIGQIENSLKEQLTQAITRLYISILKYLSNARQYYDRRTAGISILYILSGHACPETNLLLQRDWLKALSKMQSQLWGCISNQSSPKKPM